MKTVLILQARMGSSRLPGKILLPLGDSVVLNYDVARCQNVEGVDEVVVATTTLPADDAIVDWCRANEVPCFRGDQDDVLSRYHDAARAYRADVVIRVTSDCPFISYELAGEALGMMKAHPCDLIVKEGEPPRGLWSEVCSFEALDYMHRHGHELRHREHVTYFAYEYPERFHTQTLVIPEALRRPELRITLDTDEDYRMLRRLAEAFPGNTLASSSAVVQYLLEHPEIADINRHVLQKPVV